MLTLFLRRLLWLLPTLFAVSMITFLLLSLIPEDDRLTAALGEDRQAVEESRRERFLDLPRFFNANPVDVRIRANEAAAAVAKGGPEGEHAARTLVQLGGAALPHVIPGLDRFDKNERQRVALALAPVARRLGRARAEDAANEERAVDFWVRFWRDRSVEFRDASVRISVDRLARYRTKSRAAELAALDTFALKTIMERLTLPTDEASIDVARTLVEAAAHATSRYDRIEAGASVEDARACVARWHRFWLVHESDYVAFDGTERAAAAVRETRYGKWASGVVLSLTVEGDETQASLARVGSALPITLALVFGGIALAYVVGAGLGLGGAVARRALPQVAGGGLLVALHATPVAVLAVLMVRVAPASSGSLIAGIVLVATGILVSPARHQREMLSGAFAREHALAARARGATQLRALASQLRQSLMAPVSLLTIEPPAALGTAFVVEQVLDLSGLGRLTVYAVLERDTTFVVALVVGAVIIASLLTTVSDLLAAGLDPRLRGRIAGLP
ncbi:MAG: ABC transporter permease subunit [Polyangiaceae bacterium]